MTKHKTRFNPKKRGATPKKAATPKKVATPRKAAALKEDIKEVEAAVASTPKNKSAAKTLVAAVEKAATPAKGGKGRGKGKGKKAAPKAKTGKGRGAHRKGERKTWKEMTPEEQVAYKQRIKLRATKKHDTLTGDIVKQLARLSNDLHESTLSEHVAAYNLKHEKDEKFVAKRHNDFSFKPETRMTFISMSNDICSRLASNAKALADSNSEQTISSRTVLSAASQLFSQFSVKQSGKNVYDEMVKNADTAIARYRKHTAEMDAMSEETRKKEAKEGKLRISTRCGLVMQVSRIRQAMKFDTRLRMGKEAAIIATCIIEFFLTMVMMHSFAHYAHTEHRSITNSRLYLSIYASSMAGRVHKHGPASKSENERKGASFVEPQEGCQCPIQSFLDDNHITLASA